MLIQNADSPPKYVHTSDYIVTHTLEGLDRVNVMVCPAPWLSEKRAEFPWSVCVTAICESTLGDDGLLGVEDELSLQSARVRFSRALGGNENAVFLSQFTCRQRRSLKFRVRNIESCRGLIEQEVERLNPLRPCEFQIELDPEWAVNRYEYQLSGMVDVGSPYQQRMRHLSRLNAW